MAIQKYAANGEELVLTCYDGKTVPFPRHVDDATVKALGITDLPKGFVGFDVREGLAEVIVSNKTGMKLMRLGKLLKRAGKPEAEITTIGACAKKLKMLAKTSLKFTSTSEEAIHVYANGPHSCMKGKDCVGVYATDDVAVAYIEYEGEILARSVVCKNPDIGLQWTRLYGLTDVIEAALELAGYVSGYLEGCNVLHIREHGEVVMPYIDTGEKADYPNEGDKYVLLSEDGEHECDATDGFIRREMCEVCSSYEETQYSEHADQQMCDSCYQEHHTIVDGSWYHKESNDIQELEDGDYVMIVEAAYVDYRSEWHLVESCLYNEYTDEYILKSDIQ